MNFLETPEGGLIASGLIVQLQPREDGSVECYDRNGQSILLIPSNSYERQSVTVRLLKKWMRDGKRAKQPNWSYLTDDDALDKVMAELTDPKAA